MNPRDRLYHEILMARQRVYQVSGPTPLESLPVPLDAEVYVKREDLSPVHAYKWRGAYNRMAMLTPEQRERGVVASSAGNHAQGVALAARRLGIHAVIYMPVSTPRMKQIPVQRHGMDWVEVILHGDTYHEAAEAAEAACKSGGKTFIHPYNDYGTMGGQGTLADEVVMSGKGPFDAAYLQIGGGGMAASVAFWLKMYYPDIRLIGVEGEEQASMQAAVRNNCPIGLDYVDVFCDGTAVKCAGDLTYPICRDLIDEYVTVSNDEVCAAIQLFWESLRCIPEPSGAMGLAGLMQQADIMQGRRILTILCGANMDFGKLAAVARHAGIGAHRQRFYRFTIAEQQGALLHLLDTFFEDLNIVEFQYGKVAPDRAWPVLGVEAPEPVLEALEARFQDQGIEAENVTSQEDIDFRIINYEPHLFHLPYFIKLEFPERAGALRDFLKNLQNMANICYFNYMFTGETVGRALIGFEFDDEEHLEAGRKQIAATGLSYRELPQHVLNRILESG